MIWTIREENWSRAAKTTTNDNIYENLNTEPGISHAQEKK